MNPSRTACHSILGAGIVALSFGAIFARLADAPPSVVAALRMVFSALLVAVPALGSAATRRELRSLSRGEWGALALSGGFLALHFILWISSLSQTGIASSVVLVSTSPLWVGLYAAVISRRRIPAGFWTGLALALAGGAVIGGGDLASGSARSGGDVLAIGGAFAVAGYFVVGSALRRRLSIAAYVFPVYSIAAVLLVAGAAVSGDSLAGWAPRTYLYGFLMALVCQTIGHSIFNWALRHLEATVVAIASLGEPVGASVLAALILGEKPGWAAVAGGAIVLAGIGIALRFGPAARSLGEPIGSRG